MTKLASKIILKKLVLNLFATLKPTPKSCFLSVYSPNAKNYNFHHFSAFFTLSACRRVITKRQFLKTHKTFGKPYPFHLYRHRVLILTSVGFQSSKIIQSRDFASQKWKIGNLGQILGTKPKYLVPRRNPGLTSAGTFTCMPISGPHAKNGKNRVVQKKYR